MYLCYQNNCTESDSTTDFTQKQYMMTTTYQELTQKNHNANIYDRIERHYEGQFKEQPNSKQHLHQV